SSLSGTGRCRLAAQSYRSARYAHKAATLCAALTIPSNTHSRMLGALVVVAALAYLIPFVARGWVPHDEGMLAQSADRVLHGALPHVDYEEQYTGGLTYLYAALFRLAGVDLVHVRWVLFVAATGAMWLTYAVTRRKLPPLRAAVGAWG